MKAITVKIGRTSQPDLAIELTAFFTAKYPNEPTRLDRRPGVGRLDRSLAADRLWRNCTGRPKVCKRQPAYRAAVRAGVRRESRLQRPKSQSGTILALARYHLGPSTCRRRISD